MKRYIIVLFSLLTLLTVQAQEQKKFSPEKFDADMEDFVKQEAGLDAQEAAKFFPLFREMHNKQRAIYARMMGHGRSKPADEAGCAAAIKEQDKCNLELKELEQTYHKKMMHVISASKLYDVIKAENHFHRKMMKGWQKPHSPMGKPKDRRR